ncbi:Uu.00g098070.m01.CDS01 [Anthostomella pinea]|uniref:Uu.00g098070.m01.CDS01 n=1 Tax=Anthostomella pinea TaxID=933095 RepID=A0AAI8YF82_9PEZI|nr:Uu.00g098070.m01.CDS01 [Anthostomella pinea]
MRLSDNPRDHQAYSDLEIYAQLVQYCKARATAKQVPISNLPPEKVLKKLAYNRPLKKDALFAYVDVKRVILYKNDLLKILREEVPRPSRSPRKRLVQKGRGLPPASPRPSPASTEPHAVAASKVADTQIARESTGKNELEGNPALENGGTATVDVLTKP